jgi:putative ABC transport system permease protein
MIANIVSDKELVVLIHNAYAYITRKKVRTGILFLILMVILISLYECLSILSYNAQLERSLYSASHSSIVVQKKDGSEFEHTSFENSVYEYEFVSKLKEAKVVSIKQGVTLDSLPKEYKNVVSVIGTNNTSKNVLFRSGVFTLTSGKDIDSKDRNSILIHSDLAKKNHLKVGDTIVLNSHTYTIKGIFAGKKHETYTGLSSDLSENTMFVDYNSLDTKMVTKLTIDSNHLKQVQSLYPSSEYVVSKDKNALFSLD